MKIIEVKILLFQKYFIPLPLLARAFCSWGRVAPDNFLNFKKKKMPVREAGRLGQSISIKFLKQKPPVWEASRLGQFINKKMPVRLVPCTLYPC